MRYSVGLLVLLIVCGSQRSFAQETSNSGHTVSGFVRDDASNDPIQGVSLEIFASGSRAKPGTISGTDGEFLFGGLASGDYSLVATMPGYETGTVSVAILRGTSPNVTILLHKTAAVPPAGSAETISAHQLGVPSKAQDAFAKGQKLLHEDAQPAKAIPEFQRAIQEFPTYYEAYTEIGVAEYHLKNIQDAETALKKAIELSSSKYPEALFLLAELDNNERRYQEAEPLARQAVALDDSSWHGHFELARALVGLNRGEEAEASAIKARALKPDNAPVYLVLANCHLLEHHYFAVLQDFDAYLKVEPNGPQSGNIRQRRDRLQKELGNAPAQPSNPSAQPHP
ncbi:MAG: carboxypeptidase regulatory-like domain-containing protein [Candidatus Acidiferrales bacterium]